jgi:hypothetical protein
MLLALLLIPPRPPPQPFTPILLTPHALHRPDHLLQHGIPPPYPQHDQRQRHRDQAIQPDPLRHEGPLAPRIEVPKRRAEQRGNERAGQENERDGSDDVDVCGVAVRYLVIALLQGGVDLDVTG